MTPTPDLTDSTAWTTYARAAAAHRVSVRTLQRLCDAGKITRIRVPHRRPAAYLSVSDLDRVLGAAEES